MTDLVVARLTRPTPKQRAELALLFDCYRRHYGEQAAPDRTLEWLAAKIQTGLMTAFTAHRDAELIGLATVVVMPASLRLGHFWVLRDLFVRTDARRCGAAAALLRLVCEAAASDGALRVSLQTESDNVAALRLYRSSGFEPVGGLDQLTYPLA